MKKREQMLNLVAEWRKSGLSQQQFCKEQNLTLGKFSYWVAQSKPTEQSGFVTFQPGTIKDSESLEIQYPNGVVVRLGHIDLSILSGLIGLV
jgi:hypothetical protein